MLDPSQRTCYEQVVLPHLDAAYNLARWLVSNDHDAEDIVQEACRRTFRAFAGYRGGDARAWFLAAVRNTSHTWLRQRVRREALPLEEEHLDHGSAAVEPFKLLARQMDRQMVRDAIAALPMEFREVVILREMEGMSYQQIATVAGIPMGTVMSRLARARRQLQRQLAACVEEGGVS